MVVLALFGAAAAVTDFDLAALSQPGGRPESSIALVDHLKPDPRYLAPTLHEETEASEHGIRVKLKWRRINLYVPFGPN